MKLILIILLIFTSTGGYYLSSELKKYTDIGTIDEFKKLKSNNVKSS